MRIVRTATLFIVALILWISTPASLSAGDPCGHCHEQEHPEFEWIHQFTADLPTSHECAGPPGHPTHNCEFGDPSETWAPGKCNVHESCGGGSLLLRLDGGQVSGLAAARLADLYPDFASYEPGSSWLILRGCEGNVIGTKRVLLTNPAVSESLITAFPHPDWRRTGASPGSTGFAHSWAGL